MERNWPSFLAVAGLSLAAFSVISRRQKKSSTSHQPSTDSDSDCASSSTSDSSTRALPAGNYEVFLSFRGPDVRTTFADSLYHFLAHSKIRAFYDDEQLRKGEEIAPSLVQAIHESKIYIPILSQGYASSKWCLEELSLMVKSLNQNQGHILLPIFYFMEPRDVRHQEGSYSRAFRQHSRKYDAETVKEWKEALRVVGQMKGWRVTESDGQGAVIDKVFSQVWSHLMGNYTLVTDELIGVESQVREVIDLLDLDSKGLKIVGIHGMGGIGKTAISKAVFNEVSSRFERSCFLEDIRQTLLENDGVVTLQNKIISSIMRHDSHVKDTSEGIHIIRDKVCKYKVFIVLDDIDGRFEFEKIFGKLRDFSTESRFIMTTRDKRVLEFFEECRLFEAKEMSYTNSFQLFRRHAFRTDDPQEEKAALGREFVKVAAGLLLAIKVVGSLLFRKEKKVWEEKLEELREGPSTGVYEILKISYNDLSPTEKEIFLDIACFFIGETKTSPFYMWSDCKFYPESGVSNLILKSLIKVDKRNRFWMHDHIRDLGRAIVREENSQQPWTRSRIWSNEDALNMLENGQGNDKVEVLRINTIDRDYLKLTEQEFRNLSGIRFLQVTNERMTGDFSNILPNVRWLKLDRCGSIPYDINVKKVVILDIVRSCIRDDWRGWKRVKEEGKKLKVVNLWWCNELVKAPDLSSCGKLEVIKFEHCAEMRGEMHIGSFNNLVVLRLLGSKITKLKGDIGMLKDLKEIDASNLKEVPAGIGNLGSLEILSLRSSSPVDVPALPTSLKKLKHSSPKVPNLLELKELEELCFQYCLAEIPGDIWLHLTKLKSLMINYSHIKSLLLQVESAAEGSSTSSDGIMGDSVAQLPSSLSSLVVLACSKLETLPNLANLSNLTELRLQCFLVDEIRGLGQLRNLKEFAILDARYLKSLDGLQNLVLLQRLTVSNCDALDKLPSLCNLTKLDALAVLDCRVLFEIQGLDASMGESSLTDLEIRSCPKLVNVEGLLQSLQALTTLKLRDFASPDTGLLRISSFSNLKELTVMESPPVGPLHTASVPRIRILDLSGLGNLKVIKICFCQQLTEIMGFNTLQSLEELNILSCPSIQKLPNLYALQNLKKLTIRDATQLIELEELNGLESLEELTMYSWTTIKKLTNLSNLKRLDISNCTSFKMTEDCGLNSLQVLKLSQCPSILELPNLLDLTNLIDLTIRRCTELTEITGLERLESLVSLKLIDCASIVRLPDLSELKHLKALDISGCTQLAEIMGLESLELLLEMSRCKSINKLPDLSRLEHEDIEYYGMHRADRGHGS
ncbi:unnamed protein product [Linum trigynum]|uniref:TIR domain-containing protein n=1 Tax=Linum trigynum TaxID=586398 RepID=A0AAV2DK16_9ROSI